jgi:hypothetical protein
MAIICFKALPQQSKNKQGLRKITEQSRKDLNRNRNEGKYTGLAICTENRVRERGKENKPPSHPHPTPKGEKRETGEDYE